MKMTSIYGLTNKDGVCIMNKAHNCGTCTCICITKEDGALPNDNTIQ